MHQIIFQLGPFKLHSYGLMIFLAFAFGIWLGMKRAKRVGINPGKVMDISVWLLISSMIGARLMYVLFHLDEFRGRWLDVISPFQSDGTIGIAGLVVLGGVMFAVPVGWIYLKHNRIPPLKMMDILIPSLALGTAIARVGCFLNGCCFGLPTNLPWGVVFPETCYAGSVFPNQHIHPTQLYEIIYSVIIGVILLLRSPAKRFEGELLYLFFILYGPFRFLNETLRYYRESMIPFSIGEFSVTISMLLSAALTVAALIMLIRGYRKAGGVHDEG